jgi:hypothetical protein
MRFEDLEVWIIVLAVLIPFSYISIEAVDSGGRWNCQHVIVELCDYPFALLDAVLGSCIAYFPLSIQARVSPWVWSGHRRYSCLESCDFQSLSRMINLVKLFIIQIELFIDFLGIMTVLNSNGIGFDVPLKAPSKSDLHDVWILLEIGLGSI